MHVPLEKILSFSIVRKKIRKKNISFLNSKRLNHFLLGTCNAIQQRGHSQRKICGKLSLTPWSCTLMQRKISSQVSDARGFSLWMRRPWSPVRIIFIPFIFILGNTFNFLFFDILQCSFWICRVVWYRVVFVLEGFFFHVFSFFLRFRKWNCAFHFRVQRSSVSFSWEGGEEMCFGIFMKCFPLGQFQVFCVSMWGKVVIIRWDICLIIYLFFGLFYF